MGSYIILPTEFCLPNTNNNLLGYLYSQNRADVAYMQAAYLRSQLTVTRTKTA